MTITYNLGIPASANNPSVDQPNMQTNTNNIATYVAIDHVAFNTAGSGEHNQVTFAAPTSHSAPSNPVSILYTKNDANGNPQLNFINSQNEIVTASPTGSVILFAGLILKWGFYSTGGDGLDILFPTAFPNHCYQVIITSINSFGITQPISVRLGSVQKTKFATVNSSIISPISYIAIGD